MAQAQLPEVARRVLEVDEGRFRELAERLARAALRISLASRVLELNYTKIVLGPDTLAEGSHYWVNTEVPWCEKAYGHSWGTVSVSLETATIYLGAACTELTAAAAAEVATANSRTVATRLMDLYHLYKVLYRDLGTGGKPLLDLAKKAEQAGDKGMAGVLRRVYAILEASKDIVKEIEDADYSSVFEGEIEKKVEEAVGLFREAKRAAEEGDTERLYNLLGTVVFEAEEHTVTGATIRHRVWLHDIINTVHSKYYTRHHLEIDARILSGDAPPEALLKRVDIYDVFITVAEHFGLEVERPW